MEPFLFIYTTFSSKEKACCIAKEMIQASYVLCVNILDGVTSMYLDAGCLHEAKEVGVLMKTTLALSERALVYLSQNHPYQTPALLSWQAECNKSFAEWMRTRSSCLGGGHE